MSNSPDIDDALAALDHQAEEEARLAQEAVMAQEAAEGATAQAAEARKAATEATTQKQRLYDALIALLRSKYGIADASLLRRGPTAARPRQ